MRNVLTLSMDKVGKLSYTRNEQNGKKVRTNASADQLMNAIDDHSITVNIEATNKKTAPEGEVIIGGVFLGNTVSSEIDGKISVAARQQINPNVLESIDTYYGNYGISTLHEVTKAYQGGLLSKKLGISSGNSGASGSIFRAAHDAATPQGGEVYEQRYDSAGNKVRNLQETSKIVFYVQEGAKPYKIIMTYP